jgi:hypothetical protein
VNAIPGLTEQIIDPNGWLYSSRGVA